LDFTIITGLPSWYILLCILSGILASLILYYREIKSEFPTWLKYLLGINRFIVVSLIAFLLLSPLLKLVSRYSEKPIIIVAQDNSMSLVMGDDSLFYRNEYVHKLNSLLGELQSDYDVRLFTFGEEVRSVDEGSYDTLTFNDRQTDITSLYDMMDVRFANRNTGALLIASDGIFNKGMNPLYHSSSISCPIYTIALGDTSIRRDAFLKRVLYNRIAFQGNDFPVEVILNANKLSGSTISMTLTEGNSVLIREQLAVNRDNFSKTIRLNVGAGEPGMHHFVLRISSNRDEVTLKNNRFDIFVDVLQSKQKVLLLANSPHPDISAIKEAISSNINYEVVDKLLADFSGPLQEYSLIILHQIPSVSSESARLLNQINAASVPILCIIGPQTDINAFNGLKTALQLSPYNQSGMNEAVAVLSEEFTIFSLSDKLKDIVPLLPPLNTHFAGYNIVNSGGVLLYQKIGSIESTDPLWLLDKGRSVKTAVISGTGLWRWRMKCWMETGNHASFNELINKSIQFLAVKEDKRRFRLVTNENIPENTSVELKAELYNASYEPVNEPDVSLEIRDDEGNTYDFIFSKTEDAYTLNVGNFPVGTYTYSASTSLGDKVFTDGGGFTVSPVVVEQMNLRAAHGLLKELAQENNGSMLTIDNMDGLPDLLKERGDVKPLIHSEKKFIEFIDIWWILIIILSLLGVEWFFRKWSGSY